MNFEWDEAKSDACFRSRGIDFAYATAAFADPHRLIHADSRHDYGEARYELIGRIDGRIFVVIYTSRHSGIRIISARKANLREVRKYENRAPEN
jgi:uncharacterized DUF497 family protein